MCLRIPDLLRQKFTGSHQEALTKLADSISQETSILNALKMVHAPPSSTSSAKGPSRTMASPQWGGDQPQNWRQSLSLTGIPMADYEANNTFLRQVVVGYVFGGDIKLSVPSFWDSLLFCTL